MNSEINRGAHKLSRTPRWEKIHLKRIKKIKKKKRKTKKPVFRPPWNSNSLPPRVRNGSEPIGQSNFFQLLSIEIIYYANDMILKTQNHFRRLGDSNSGLLYKHAPRNHSDEAISLLRISIQIILILFINFTIPIHSTPECRWTVPNTVEKPFCFSL